MIYILAGHTPKGINQDPGAVSVHNKITYREADLTMELRDLIADEIRSMGGSVWEDDDTHRLNSVLIEVKSTEKDVVCDIHFNSAANNKATGVEVFIPDRFTGQEFAFGKKLCDRFSLIMGIPNRGVRTESQSNRGRIGTLREFGINLLIEVGFLSNATDLARYQEHKKKIVREAALILFEADNLIK